MAAGDGATFSCFTVGKEKSCPKFQDIFLTASSSLNLRCQTCRDLFGSGIYTALAFATLCSAGNCWTCSWEETAFREVWIFFGRNQTLHSKQKYQESHKFCSFGWQKYRWSLQTDPGVGVFTLYFDDMACILCFLPSP